MKSLLSLYHVVAILTVIFGVFRNCGMIALGFKVFVVAGVWKCTSKTACLILSTAAVCSGSSIQGLDYFLLLLLIVSSPSEFSWHTHDITPVLTGQILAAAICTKVWQTSPSLIFLALVAAGVALYVSLTYDFIRKQENVLEDSLAEANDLKGELSLTKNKAMLVEKSLERISAHRSKIMEAKLRKLFPGRVRTKRGYTEMMKGSFSRRGESIGLFEDRMALFRSEENMLLSLESEPDSIQSESHDMSDERDLSGEDAETLMTSILSKEYLLWSDRKVKKPAMANDKFIQMLLQSRDVRLKSEGKHFHRDFSRLRPTIEENPELSDIFDRLCEWDFDTFDLIRVTSEPLKEVSIYIFSALNLTEQFSISKETLESFLSKVERCYRPENYYHNSLHATDVLNSVYFLLYSGVHRSGQFLELEVLALVTSALAHDMGHPGVNNAFLINSQDPLSLLYNDRSVLEMMHSSSLFSILRRPDSNILRSLGSQDFTSFRKIAIALILATDLQRHFEKVAEFKAALDNNLGLEVAEFRMLAMEICLKCADIGHCAKELQLHKRWTSLLANEFFEQGKREQQLNLPISPLCNPEAVILCKSQMSFITAFVQPIYLQWEDLANRIGQGGEGGDQLPVAICLVRIAENLSFWEAEGANMETGAAVFEIEKMQPPLLASTKR